MCSNINYGSSLDGIYARSMELAQLVDADPTDDIQQFAHADSIIGI
jgi:hypothetical protein